MPSSTAVDLDAWATILSAGGSSSVGRASAFQAECRGFEPRLPLQLPLRRRAGGPLRSRDQVRPSRAMRAPVIAAASSEQRKRIAVATSSGVVHGAFFGDGAVSRS
jgi:hypothetical protein